MFVATVAPNQTLLFCCLLFSEAEKIVLRALNLLCWDPSPVLHKPCVVVYACNPSTGEVGVGDQKVKATLTCTVSSGPASFT